MKGTGLTDGPVGDGEVSDFATWTGVNVVRVSFDQSQFLVFR